MEKSLEDFEERARGIKEYLQTLDIQAGRYREMIRHASGLGGCSFPNIRVRIDLVDESSKLSLLHTFDMSIECSYCGWLIGLRETKGAILGWPKSQ